MKYWVKGKKGKKMIVKYKMEEKEMSLEKKKGFN